MFINLPEQLLSKAQLKMKSDHLDYRAKSALRHALPFDNIKPPRGKKDVGVIASSYNPENPLDIIFPKAPVVKPHQRGIIDPSNNLSYAKVLLPKGVGIQISAANDFYGDGGRAYFDDDINVPVLSYNRHGSWDVWMSLTPMELWTQRSGIQAATGEVVIGGLGMGWLLRQVAKKKSVTSRVTDRSTSGSPSAP